MSASDPVIKESDPEYVGPKRRSTDFEGNMQVYTTVCNDRFSKIEEQQAKHTDLLIKINSKVHNGYDSEIENLKETVKEVKSINRKEITDLKEENEKEHKELKDGQHRIQKSVRNLIITIVVSLLTVGGGILAAVLTGFFGLLEKIATSGGLN